MITRKPSSRQPVTQETMDVEGVLNELDESTSSDFSNSSDNIPER